MAKTQQKAGAAKTGKNKKFKKRERKNVPFGLVFIQASFNNTIVTITDGVGKGDWIVLNPPDSLADGTKVQVHEMQAASPAPAH